MMMMMMIMMIMNDYYSDVIAIVAINCNGILITRNFIFFYVFRAAKPGKLQSQQTRLRIGFVKIAVSDSIFMMYVYMNNIDWCDFLEIKKNSHQHDDNMKIVLLNHIQYSNSLLES